MLIQTPGSFVWSGSLAARLGIEGWSTWGVFLVTGCLQGCLLGMGIYFEVKARNAKPSHVGQVGFLQGENGQPETDDEGGTLVESGWGERTPLLNGSRKSSQTPLPQR